jgi:hypothetical protein
MMTFSGDTLSCPTVTKLPFTESLERNNCKLKEIAYSIPNEKSVPKSKILAGENLLQVRIEIVVALASHGLELLVTSKGLHFNELSVNK